VSTDSNLQKRNPTESANATAGDTDHQVFAEKPAKVNAFRALKDRFAFQGRRLFRTDPTDGRVLYFIERLGLVQLADRDHAIAILQMMEAR